MKYCSGNICLVVTEILLVSGFLSGFSLAQEAQVAVSSKVDRSRITIGDLIIYTVTVTHDKEIGVEMPGLGANLGEFEIRDYDVHEPMKEEGMIVTEVGYTISTFFTGEFEIPPLIVRYFTPGDSTAKTLTTEKIKIVVESVKPSEAADIRDIKPPVEIPRNWWYLLRWFVVGGSLVGVGILVYIVYRRKKAGKGLLPIREAPPRPPHEVAYEALDRLRDSDLLAKGETKVYYTEVSEIIRQYIEGRYFIVAMEMTTTEVLEGLSGAEVSEEEFQLFKTFLDRCDLVKFAKVIPSAEENDEILRMAYDIVNRTKILMEETASEESAEEVAEGPTREESEDDGGKTEEEVVSVEAGEKQITDSEAGGAP